MFSYIFVQLEFVTELTQLLPIALKPDRLGLQEFEYSIQDIRYFF